MKKFSTQILAALGLSASLVAGAGSAMASESEHELHQIEWSFDGYLGKFDQAALQRGFQVYQEVCSACHGMDYLSYRNLGEGGGPMFSEAEVKAIAAQKEVFAGPDEYGDIVDENGSLLMRTAIPSDRFANPYQNEQAAIAANGTLPPDLSVMAKARADGPNYIYSLLAHGYEEHAPEGMEIGEGLQYNAYFPGGQISMTPPLFEEAVEYADGTEASIDQMAKDVSHFLMWAAEPHLEARKSAGVKAMLFLITFALLMFWTYRRLWSDVDH